MNIQQARQAITEFLSIRLRIDTWGLDEPTRQYTTHNQTTLPANSARSLPIQNVIHTKDSFNVVRVKARFPYQIAYRFPGVMPYHDIPFNALEGMLEFIHILFLMETPDPEIQFIAPVLVEDAITYYEAGEEKVPHRDWIVYRTYALTQW